jgi:CheY-like chemotaxis protein
MTIMIIDDDGGIRELITLYLAHNGYAAISASNGKEALDQLERDQVPPQLILLDLMMPVMDGAEFRQAQLAAPQLAGIPVIVMSAAENIESQAPALTANAYLPKPVDFDALLQLVQQYSQQTRQQGA